MNTNKRKMHKTRISASYAAALFGLHPSITPLMLWAYVHEGRPLYKDDNTSTLAEMGQALEPMILKKAGLALAVDVRIIPEYMERDGVGARVDGAVLRPRKEIEKGIIEAKFVSHWGEKAWKNGVPPHVTIQCMINMYVFECRHCWVAKLSGDDGSLSLFEIEMDDAFMERILHDANEFLSPDFPRPKVESARDLPFIQDAYTTKKGLERVMTGDEIRMCEEYRHASGQALSWGKLTKDMKARILEFAEDHEILLGLNGGAVRVKEIHNEGGTREIKPFDYKRLQIPKSTIAEGLEDIR